MKITIAILATTLIMLTGCTGEKQSTDELITIDVTASYPKKELILQDFMDVEYIPLETTDEFLCQGLLQAVGKDIVIVRNRTQDGNIFIYDRHGKAIKRINRLGQGGEEYQRIARVVLDEENGELFVNDNASKRIVVYDMNGTFRRSLHYKEKMVYEYIYNFDQKNLICNNGSLRNEGQSFLIISKLDGSITKEIYIPFKEKKQVWLSKTDETTGLTYVLSPNHFPIIPYSNGWLLVEQSADSVYFYLPDHTMKPFIARTPSIQSMDPETFLLMGALTKDYIFMETVIKKGDLIKQTGLPSTYLVYDRASKTIFNQTVYNDDYTVKTKVAMHTHPINNEITNYQILNANNLVESYSEGKLKGRLKEIAATLDEESNPVIMLAKQKK